MSILIDETSRIIIQGITGINGRNLAGRMLEGRTPLVGGVTPGRGGEHVHDLPVLDSCYEAVERLGATASFVSVPAPVVLGAAMEAIDAGIKLLVIYTEGVPVGDAIVLRAFAQARGAVLLGPNAAGCVSPGKANLSDLNDLNLRQGRIGILSKSGTLTYEVIDELNRNGLGQSTVVCLGGDPVTGTRHAEALPLFADDPQTDAVVLIGEIGGRSELEAAEIIRTMRKPVIAYIAGRAAPPGKRMGHAGALLGAGEENAPGKNTALKKAGAWIAEDVLSIGDLVLEALEATKASA